MNETERISSKELQILGAHDKGKTNDEIAILMGMSADEVTEILELAKSKRDRLIAEAGSGGAPFIYFRPIDGTIDIPQKGTMKVGSQILKLLSEGIYSSPANSIKELISNSFDADGTIVRVSVESDEVVIWDDGGGMDYADFDERFTYISRSMKRDEGYFTKKYKRPMIGFIGIGFIAVSELCDIATITSAKEDSDLMFEAKIDFSMSRASEAVTKEFYEVSQFELTNFRKADKGYSKEVHFTEIRLKKLRPSFRRMLLDKRSFENTRPQMHEIIDYLEKEEIRSIGSLGEYWQFILQLAYISPVTYLEDGPVRRVPEDTEEYSLLQRIKNRLKDYNFTVVFDGIELKKPFLFPTQADKIMYNGQYKVHTFKESKTVDGKSLSFVGYIYSQHGSVRPKEYNGIITRIRNVAIGNPDSTLLGYPLGTNLVFRHWVFGEIYVEEGLEEAMTIDRSSFKLTHPHYLYLQEYIHGFLEKVFDFCLDDYYYAERYRKAEEEKKNERKALTEMAVSEFGQGFVVKLTLGQEDEPPVMIDGKHRCVLVNQNHTVFRHIPKRKRGDLEKFLILFEIAVEESQGDLKRLRQTFLKLLRKWL